jgi:hypothetical protein
MDDKTLNLWRQIESCRRRPVKRAVVPGPSPAKPVNDN